MTWDPSQYLKFEQPRLRPALELLARVPLASPQRVVDLGCGAGQLTRLMAERWPQAQVLGVDSSAAMLEKAAGEALPNMRWQQEDLGRWQAEQPVDLLYSNAALHWLPQHAQLLPRLLAQVAPGGVFAVQMPRNFSAPSHTLIAETVMAGPWRERLAPLLRPKPVEDPGWYHDLLSPLVADLDLWETEYHQVLSGPDPVKEWTKGTWLITFLNALQGEEREAFERDYAERVRVAYPAGADGRTRFPFRRLFIVARRA